MADIADTLITKYVLDDKYSAALQKIVNHTNGFAKAAKKAQGSGGGTSGMAGAFNVLKGGANEVTVAIAAVTAAFAAAGAMAGGMVEFGMKAMTTFAGYDTIERTFSGIYDSASKAKDMMKFLNTEAQKSNFLFTDLAQNAKLVVMTGLKWSEYSNSIQGLALRKGGSGEDLAEATRVLTRLKGGQFGEAMSDLGSFGYGKEELTRLGATFDKSGQFLGNTQQALEIFKKIGKESEGVVKAMDGGAEAILGNLTESFTLAMSEIGKSIFNNVKGGITSVTDAISDAISSGALGDMVDSIFAMFDPDPNSFSLTKVIASVIAGVETAASFVKTVWSFIVSAYNFLAPILKFLGAYTPGGMAGRLITDDLGTVYNASYERTMATMEAYQKTKAKGKEIAEPDSGKAMATSPLAQIAQNTKHTADNTKHSADMARHVLGGGDLGRMGVTPQELDGLLGRRSGGGDSIKVQVIGDSFDALLNDLLQRYTKQLQQQGRIR